MPVVDPSFRLSRRPKGVPAALPRRESNDGSGRVLQPPAAPHSHAFDSSPRVGKARSATGVPTRKGNNPALPKGRWITYHPSLPLLLPLSHDVLFFPAFIQAASMGCSAHHRLLHPLARRPREQQFAHHRNSIRWFIGFLGAHQRRHRADQSRRIQVDG